MVSPTSRFSSPQILHIMPLVRHAFLFSFLSYLLPDNLLLYIFSRLIALYKHRVVMRIKTINIKLLALNEMLLILFSLDIIFISPTISSSFPRFPSWSLPSISQPSLPSSEEIVPAGICHFLFLSRSQNKPSLLFPFIKTNSWEICINMQLLSHILNEIHLLPGRY